MLINGMTYKAKAPEMTEAKTLLELSGADLTPAKLRSACLILIDFQNEYLAGPIAVQNANTAIASAARLLATARQNATPVIHVAQKGGAGGLFDRAAARGQIVSDLSPLAEETVVEKGLPNAFAGTDLQALLTANGRKDLILVGLMTHMCVSSTARAALDLGYRVTIDATGCASRGLPDGRGGMIPAETIHEVALVELSDRFAIVSRNTDELL
jgi:nicotinamidase-related amidase